MRAGFRPSLFQRAVMGVTALIALAIGLRALTDPAGFLNGMQMAAVGPAGLNETRGQYGAFFIALVLYAGLGAAGIVRTTSVLAMLLVLYAGVLAGRVIHLALVGFDAIGSYPPIMQAIHVVDLVGLIASALALRQGRATRAEPMT